jgi:D-alanyl-D-alanine dipeptidase
MMRLLLLCLLVATQATAQMPPVTSSVDALRREARADSGHALVRLQQVVRGLKLDIRYATPNNFTGKAQYTMAAAWLRQRPARALAHVQQQLATHGYGLMVYDAYRPYAVTVSLWRSTTAHRFVANPRKGSQHNRGIAVDITLIDLHTGAELDMGTGYDNFTDSAHHDFKKLPATVLARRSLLKKLMIQNGFNAVPNEWWHYHWRDKNYTLLNIPFEKLEGANYHNQR